MSHNILVNNNRITDTDLGQAIEWDYGYVKDCKMVPRVGDPPMFDSDGLKIVPHLNRYAIIPIEVYDELRKKAGEKV